MAHPGAHIDAHLADFVQVHTQDETFKVNDVIEVVGVLSRLPELAAFPEAPESSSEDADIFEYDSSSLPPNSKVVQCLWF